jgi:hypothetical protein
MKIPSSILHAMCLGAAGAGVLLAVGCQDAPASSELLAQPVLAAETARQPALSPAPLMPMAPQPGTSVQIAPQRPPPSPGILAALGVPDAGGASTEGTEAATLRALTAAKRREREQQQQLSIAMSNRHSYAACGMG